MDKPPEIKTIEITEGNKTQTVYIPLTGDRVWDRDLEQMAQEKTRNELRKSPPKSKPKISQREIQGVLKEYASFRRRENKKKYY